MAKDLNFLARKMKLVAKAVDEDVNSFTKELVKDVQFEVAERTPVDVGTARSNWIVRVGYAWSMVYRAFSPGRHLGRGERGNLSAVSRQGAAAVTTKKSSDVVYITNNLPYINRLNQGYSRQSPSGFVQIGISVGVRKAVTGFKFKAIRRVF